MPDDELGDDAEGTLTYDFAYSWHSTYARAARLIASQAVVGAVLDLGAGVGTLGEAVERYDLGYLAVDSDGANVAAMRARGRVAHRLDLLVDDAAGRILEIVAGQDEPIVAVAMLDVIEHLPDPERTVSVVREVVDRLGSRQAEMPIVVMSVPNVAHHDLGTKLLLGRWDVTPTGLLDSTHVTLFTEDRLEALMSAGGFAETCRDDVIFEVTEQRDPADLPVFGSTLLADHLRALREAADHNGRVYQFVRSYSRCLDRPDGAESDDRVAGDVRSDVGTRPFLSVVVRTQGTRTTLLDTLTSLAAQHDRDIEVLLMVHSDAPNVTARVRLQVATFETDFSERVDIHHVAGGGRSRPLNAALALAVGRYLAILDDDDIVTPHWVASFRRLGEQFPGRLVRSGCVVQRISSCDEGTIDFSVDSGFERSYPDHFDVLDSIRSNRSPACSYAVPLDAVRALGITFDESLRVCEDWKFELEVARICGTADHPLVTSVYRRWRADSLSSDAEGDAVWVADHEAVIDALDETPTLLPAGSLRRIHELYRYVEQLEAELGRRRPDDGPYSASH